AAPAPVPAGPAPSGVPAPAAQAIPENTDALTPRASAALSPAPGVAAVATIAHGAVLTPIARERGWVRVQLEGWMREDDLTAADSSIARLSAADLRANPDAYAGHLVRWAVQVLAFQTADEMRRDLKLNEPYLLAKGPGDEGALLYLTLPPALVDNAKALTPMTNVIVVARVRTGRGDPSGVPILDVLALTRR
ncbi:MAG TPA: hypothetical protein VG818_01485, partial [Gemmatimonadaceae bacterium]|nr:hypothetical protein [Gemmatimonadaceae bacterium]